MTLFLCLSGISMGRYFRKSLAKSKGFRKNIKRGEMAMNGEGGSNLLHTMIGYNLIGEIWFADKPAIDQKVESIINFLID